MGGEDLIHPFKYLDNRFIYENIFPIIDNFLIQHLNFFSRAYSSPLARKAIQKEIYERVRKFCRQAEGPQQPFRISKYRILWKGRVAFGPISMEIRGWRRERHASTANKKRNVCSGRVLKVRTPVSSVPFLPLFSPRFRTAEVGGKDEGRGRGWCVGTCEECDMKNRLPARYSSETDGCLISRGLRNREPLIRFLLAVHRHLQFNGIGTLEYAPPLLRWSKVAPLLIVRRKTICQLIVSCDICECFDSCDDFD